MATEHELKKLRKRIYEVSANKSATKEDWFALWREAERCRKTCNNKTWAEFYWLSGLEMVDMLIAGYEYEDQKEKEQLKTKIKKHS